MPYLYSQSLQVADKLNRSLLVRGSCEAGNTRVVPVVTLEPHTV